MKPTLVPREEPLPPKAVVGQGPVAVRLAERVARLPAEEQRALQVIAVADLFVVLGDTARLPWVDGVRYLGVDPRAPGMWLWTTQTTSVAVELVERALRRSGRIPQGPFALLSFERLLPLGRATAVSPSSLALVRGTP